MKPIYKENHIKNYVKDTLADTGKTKRELGFEARWLLEDGLAQIIGKETRFISIPGSFAFGIQSLKLKQAKKILVLKMTLWPQNDATSET